MTQRDQPTRPLIRGAEELNHDDEPAIFKSLRQELERLGRTNQARCSYVIVEVDHGTVSRRLVVDGDWLEFAKEAETWQPSVIADLDLPTAALVAVLPLRQAHDDAPASTTKWSLRPDGVLQLV